MLKKLKGVNGGGTDLSKSFYIDTKGVNRLHGRRGISSEMKV
jgi:hypothetical protein